MSDVTNLDSYGRPEPPSYSSQINAMINYKKGRLKANQCSSAVSLNELVEQICRSLDRLLSSIESSRKHVKGILNRHDFEDDFCSTQLKSEILEFLQSRGFSLSSWFYVSDSTILKLANTYLLRLLCQFPILSKIESIKITLQFIKLLFLPISFKTLKNNLIFKNLSISA